MIDQKPMCDDEQLERMLRQDSDRCDGDSLLDHVEGCTRCQRRLDELAADDSELQRTVEVLTSDSRGAKSGDFHINRAHVGLQRNVWTESMAQQLLSSARHPEMLGRIGRYDVERLIGSGGFGVVFKGYDTELNRSVAVKLLAPYLASGGAARKRFAREARAAAAVVDDHVVPIYNVETDGDHPFLVMKYIAGGSLQQRLNREGPLEVCEVLRIGMQTAKGLAAAHAQGLIHRDVKPSNVLLDEGVDRALLTDFGLARATDDASLTRSGFHPGTPHYMSPEQVRGELIDARSDLFGLGCVLYALCTGHPPFRSETSYAVLRRITDDTPRPIRETNSDVPVWLEQIVMKLLAKSAGDRFDSAEQVAEILEGSLAHVQNPTTTWLPESVVKLAVEIGPNDGKALAAMFGGFRHPPVVKLIAAAAIAFSIMLAGVLIVLERNKGTLTIESDFDDVPIRIVQGDQVVQSLTVSREGKSTRISAGKYTIEVDRVFDNVVVSNGVVKISRGGEEFVKLSQLDDDSGPVARQQTPPQTPTSQDASIRAVVHENSIGMRFADIPAGSFRMGRKATLVQLFDKIKLYSGIRDYVESEQPQHPVQISSFQMQISEVTQEHWEAIMETRPWENRPSYDVKTGPGYPATFVTWEDARTFCKRLSEREGILYRLPTEAEWEYACRAQSTTMFPFGDGVAEIEDYGWVRDNAYSAGEHYPHRVGRKKPNAWKLFDMHANVFEWCNDWYGPEYYKNSPENDPIGPSSGSLRVIRGGDWRSSPVVARSASRFAALPTTADFFTGFRVVRSGTNHGRSENQETKRSNDGGTASNMNASDSPVVQENATNKSDLAQVGGDISFEAGRFQTPEELMTYFDVAHRSKDTVGALRCCSDDVINHLAAICLVRATRLQKQLEKEGDPVGLGRKWRERLQQAKTDNAPAIAELVLSRAVDTGESREQNLVEFFVMSSSFLKDARRFVSECREFHSMQAVNSRPSKYSIRFDSDGVWAINGVDGSRMRLKEFDRGWLIDDPTPDALREQTLGYRVRSQRHAVATIENAGGVIYYDWMLQPMHARDGSIPYFKVIKNWNLVDAVSWMQKVRNRDHFQKVVQIGGIQPHRIDDNVISAMSELKGLEQVDLQTDSPDGPVLTFSQQNDLKSRMEEECGVKVFGPFDSGYSMDGE